MPRRRYLTVLSFLSYDNDDSPGPGPLRPTRVRFGGLGQTGNQIRLGPGVERRTVGREEGKVLCDDRVSSVWTQT